MDDAIAAIRRFNRFFTRHVGALDAHFLDADATLPEARLLFEIATRAPVLATELQAVLGFDRGHLSRLIARLEARGWISRGRAADARARPIELTDAGRTTFTTIDTRQRAAVAADLDRLDPLDRADLIEALTRARLLLDPANTGPFTLRPFRIGDASLIAARQSVLYDQVYGWGRGLERVEAETVAAFLRDFTPGREQCWVAEIEGVMAGAVFLSDEGGDVARLRLLHVEPFGRRRGIGDALVAECLRFARETGYREMMLWTHTVLEAARRLYARHGFELVSIATHDSFGEPVQGETWHVSLR